jgi:hypothetical protein
LLPGSKEDLAAVDSQRDLLPADTKVSNFAEWRTAHEPPIWAATWIVRVTVVTAPERLSGSRPGETSLG